LEHSGLATIVRPKRLFFASFGRYDEWAFFWLDTIGLQPTGLYPDLRPDFNHEEVTEIAPAKYVDRSAWDEGCLWDEDGNQQPLPDGARPLTRMFWGSFIIFAKGSSFNKMDDYSGRNNRLAPEEFQRQVAELLEHDGVRLEAARRRRIAEERENDIDW
jgi:hypothetical protein